MVALLVVMAVGAPSAAARLRLRSLSLLVLWETGGPDH